MTNTLLRLLFRPLMSEIGYRTGVDKAKGEPLVAEEALVHAKSEHCDCYIIHFYIASRDTVVNCDMPYEVWRALNKGWRGILCHQGGDFYSFEYEGILYCEDTMCTSES